MHCHGLERDVGLEWHQTGIKQASNRHQTGIKDASKTHQTGIKQASNRHQTGIKHASKTHQTGIKQASNRHQAGIKQASKRPRMGPRSLYCDLCCLMQMCNSPPAQTVFPKGAIRDYLLGLVVVSPSFSIMSHHKGDGIPKPP